MLEEKNHGNNNINKSSSGIQMTANEQKMHSFNGKIAILFS